MNTNCNYINHPLNNSPSKNAYSFARTSRFLTAHEAKCRSEESKKFISISKQKDNPSSNTSFTKDSLKNKKEESQQKCVSRQRVKSLHCKEKHCNEQKKVQYLHKNWRPKEQKEMKIKTEAALEEKIVKKDNPSLLLKVSSQPKLPPRPSTKRESGRDDGKSAISKAKSPSRLLQAQMKNSMAYTFSRSPRHLHDKDEQLGPGRYNMHSQFGHFANYTSFKK